MKQLGVQPVRDSVFTSAGIRPNGLRRGYADCGLLDMADERDRFTVRDDEGLSPEEQYELWEWARAAGVSAEELRSALQRAERAVS
jgi:hypothetical protein